MTSKDRADSSCVSCQMFECVSLDPDGFEFVSLDPDGFEFVSLDPDGFGFVAG